MRGLLILGLLTLALGCDKKTEPTTPPSGWSPPVDQALLGEWHVVINEESARGPTPTPAGKIWVMKFDGTKISVTVEGEKEEYQYTTDSTANPKTIDMWLSSEGVGKSHKGIYEFRGDRLVMSLPDLAPTARPTELKAKGPPDKIILMTLSRTPNKAN